MNWKNGFLRTKKKKKGVWYRDGGGATAVSKGGGSNLKKLQKLGGKRANTKGNTSAVSEENCGERDGISRRKNPLKSGKVGAGGTGGGKKTINVQAWKNKDRMEMPSKKWETRNGGSWNSLVKRGGASFRCIGYGLKYTRLSSTRGDIDGTRGRHTVRQKGGEVNQGRKMKNDSNKLFPPGRSKRGKGTL